MKKRFEKGFGLIVTGHYANENEALHALRDPFIEDWVEQTGRFRIHQLNSLMIAPGVALGQLEIIQQDNERDDEDQSEFLIASCDPKAPLTAKKVGKLAEALRYQAMFDEIEIVPLDEEGEIE
jgi:hypothetical protein